MVGSAHGEADMSKLGGYSLGKALGAALGAALGYEVGTERGSTDGCSGKNGDGKPEDY